MALLPLAALSTAPLFCILHTRLAPLHLTIQSECVKSFLIGALSEQCAAQCDDLIGIICHLVAASAAISPRQMRIFWMSSVKLIH